MEDYVSKIEKAVEECKINQLNYIVILLQSEFTYSHQLMRLHVQNAV